MKKILLLLLVTANLVFANEPEFKGAYYGEVRNNMNSWAIYPDNTYSSAGNVYLYKNNMNSKDYIYDSKTKHITRAIDEAKKYAIKTKYKNYAVGNIKHQVIAGDNEVIILTDYNIFAFD